jgi:hypothetical protein
VGAIGLAVLGAVLLDPDPLTREQYAAEVGAAYAGVQAAFRETRGVSGEQLAARVGDAQAALREAAGRIDGLDPPADAERANDELVSGLREYAGDLDELRAAAERGDEAAQERFNASLSGNAAVRRLTTAAQRLEAAGYEIEGLGDD